MQLAGEHVACVEKEEKTGFRSRNLKERDHLLDTLRWRDNNKMDLKQRGLECIDWIHLAPNWDQWRATLNMAMPFQFLQISGDVLSELLSDLLPH